MVIKPHVASAITRGRNTEGGSMTRFPVAKLRRFKDSAEIEKVFYGSQQLEVRTGIIHALASGYPIDKISPDWCLNFLLTVCEDSLREAARLGELNRKTPYPNDRASHEDTMKGIEQKNEWIGLESDHSRIASLAAKYPMSDYIGERRNSYGGPPSNADKAAERVLSLMSSWTTAPPVSWWKGSLGRTVKEFLGVYLDHVRGEAPDTWYQAVIHARQFDLFRDHRASRDKVRKNLIAYLQEAVIRDGRTTSKATAFSALASGENTIHSRDAAEYLARHLHTSGSLDSLIKLTTPH